jgi:nucleotide-binding universal stress UspA family protein
MLKHVLVPLDSSELAEEALDYARELTGPGGKVTLLMVVQAPEYVTSGFYPVPFEYQVENYESIRENRINEARDYLQKTASKLTHDDIEVSHAILVGNPAEGIIELADAENVDAIVMSTHGRSGLSRWIFGSVTQKVLSGTSRPVFVVPSREKETAGAH